MKICIITVYNTENCGSFLQAMALASTLSDMGNEVYFLKRELKDTPNSIKRHCVEILKRIAKLNFAGVKNEIEMYRGYRKAQRCFKEITPQDDIYNEIDYFVFGSDTIWNINEPYFANRIGTYFGASIDGKKVAYAPSIGGTSLQKFKDDDRYTNAIKDFYALSARDAITAELIKIATDKEATIVCDPTMLLSKDRFNEIIKDMPVIDDAPIFVYYFGKLSQKRIDEIKAFAKQNNKRIVAMERVCKWADKTVAFNPHTFLQYYRDSSYVVTNTFHGSIFCLIYNKRFANLGQSKAKVRHLLESTKAQAGFVDENESISDTFSREINYDETNKIMNEIRQGSINYLKDSIK